MSNKSFVTSLLILLFALSAASVIFFRPEPVVVRTNLERLPMTINGYMATEDSFSEGVYRELNADKHVYRHYQSQNGARIDLYIGYYGTAKGGRTGHNPYACLPGGGSAIVETGKVEIRRGVAAETVPVNFILSRKDERNTVMLHWYQTAGRTVVSTGLLQNMERFSGRLFHNRNDGAFVQITASVADADMAKARQRVEQFAGVVLSLLPDYWPEEQ
jgi:EpsI family protein